MAGSSKAIDGVEEVFAAMVSVVIAIRTGGRKNREKGVAHKVRYRKTLPCRHRKWSWEAHFLPMLSA